MASAIRRSDNGANPRHFRGRPDHDVRPATNKECRSERPLSSAMPVDIHFGRSEAGVSYEAMNNAGAMRSR
jgi:hypothetical protein